MSSRLALDSDGLPIVIAMIPGDGCRIYRILGNEVRAVGGGRVFAFVGETSARPPSEPERLGIPRTRSPRQPATPRERLGTRALVGMTVRV